MSNDRCTFIFIFPTGHDTLDHQSVKAELSREILWICSPSKLEMLKIVRSIISLWWISGSTSVFEAWCNLVMKFKHTSTYRSNSGQIVQRPPTPKTSKTSYTKSLGFWLRGPLLNVTGKKLLTYGNQGI